MRLLFEIFQHVIADAICFISKFALFKIYRHLHVHTIFGPNGCDAI